MCVRERESPIYTYIFVRVCCKHIYVWTHTYTRTHPNTQMHTHTHTHTHICMFVQKSVSTYLLYACTQYDDTFRVRVTGPEVDVVSLIFVSCWFLAFTAFFHNRRCFYHLTYLDSLSESISPSLRFMLPDFSPSAVADGRDWTSCRSRAFNLKLGRLAHKQTLLDLRERTGLKLQNCDGACPVSECFCVCLSFSTF
jgi:hypothetical protein